MKLREIGGLFLALLAMTACIVSIPLMVGGAIALIILPIKFALGF